MSTLINLLGLAGREIEMIDHKTRVVRRAAKLYDIDSAKDFIDFSAKLFGLGLAAALCAAWTYGTILIVSVVFGD